MSLPQVVSSWYLILGVVWFLAMLRGVFMDGSIKDGWAISRAYVVGIVIGSFVVSLALWPVSLLFFYRTGKLRSLFS